MNKNGHESYPAVECPVCAHFLFAVYDAESTKELSLSIIHGKGDDCHNHIIRCRKCHRLIGAAGVDKSECVPRSKHHNNSICISDEADRPPISENGVMKSA